ncbi:MAG: CocE/NonD family hydrolase, partial [Chloroflexota bacterium]|nr:CocE/NonD family hydrolase [Chloroflexota bacterium]
QDKWLLVHGRKKWQHFYENVERQRQFFDRFLKGVDSEVKYWPRVSLEVRERFFIGNFRSETEWPPSGTRYEQLFLDPGRGQLGRSRPEEEGVVRYPAAPGGGRACFDHRFAETTDVVGHMKLRLWVEAHGSDDMDLFVALQKVDRTGDVVTFPYYSSHDNGPVALGWLRVSHRELDEERSRPYQPVMKHRRELKLKPGEIVPVDIEIWPSGTRFEAGETLRLIVQGTDVYTYPEEMNTIAHTDSVNAGEHRLHAGGRFDSHLLVPVLP